MKNGAFAAFVSGALISVIALGWFYAGRVPDAPQDAPPQDVGPSVLTKPSPAPETVPPSPDAPRAVAGPARCTERPQDLKSTKAPALVEGPQIGPVQLGRIDPACWSWEGDRRAAGEGDGDAEAEPLATRTPEPDAAPPTRPPTASPPPVASAAAPPRPVEAVLRPSISPSAPSPMRLSPRPKGAYPIPYGGTRAAARPPIVRTGSPARACRRTIVRSRY